jgi:hypothetical protein
MPDAFSKFPKKGGRIGIGAGRRYLEHLPAIAKDGGDKSQPTDLVLIVP